MFAAQPVGDLAIPIAIEAGDVAGNSVFDQDGADQDIRRRAKALPVGFERCAVVRVFADECRHRPSHGVPLVLEERGEVRIENFAEHRIGRSGRRQSANLHPDDVVPTVF